MLGAKRVSSIAGILGIIKLRLGELNKIDLLSENIEAQKGP